MQALLGYTSEARWLRYAQTHLRSMFPRLPHQPGYNKRLRKLATTMAWLVTVLGALLGAAAAPVLQPAGTAALGNVLQTPPPRIKSIINTRKKANSTS